MSNVIAWLALSVAIVSAGTSVWALVETYRSRPRPELAFEWSLDKSSVEQGDRPVARLRVVNHSEATALDVRVSIDIATNAYGAYWWGPNRLLPTEAIDDRIPLFRSKRGSGPHGLVNVPSNGQEPNLNGLDRPTVQVEWRQEPNTKKIRHRESSAPDSVLPANASFHD